MKMNSNNKNHISKNDLEIKRRIIDKNKNTKEV